MATAESEPPVARETLSLTEAVARGAVTVRARGGGVQNMTLEVNAHASVDLVIPAGTYFRADAGVHGRDEDGDRAHRSRQVADTDARDRVRELPPCGAEHE
ncbi:MAG: hypothetical protein M4D80_01875 [Myxococcota bacterium]|nr:hypothetical protein [Myxococcota bacterium]